MYPAIAAHAIHQYTRPGDLVLDPMCGIATTLVEAVHQGRHGIGVEYEPRWAALARANLSLAARTGAAGVGRVVRADARDLPKVVRPAVSTLLTELPDQDMGGVAVMRPVSLVVTSPPYGAHTYGQVSTDASRTGPVTKTDYRYGPRPGSANLAHADLDGLLDGFTRILSGAVALLAPGGHVVVTTRPYRRNGELVDLPTAVIGAAEATGLTLVERAVALTAGLRGNRIVPRASFFQILMTRRARAEGLPQQLIVHEDVLIFRLATGVGEPINHHSGPSPANETTSAEMVIPEAA